MNNLLVTVITCTTASRKSFFEELTEHLSIQSYQNIEWIVSEDEIMSIGAKKNICCKEAKGEYIIVCDDDDYFSSLWVEKSVNAIVSSGADIIGLNKAYFESKEHKWLYEYKGIPPFVLGSGMCFKRSWWEKHPFKDSSVGEDVAFQIGAFVIPHDYIDGFTATIHDNNTASHLALKNKEFTMIY